MPRMHSHRHRVLQGLAVIVLLLAPAPPAAAKDEATFARERAAMVREIDDDAHGTADFTERPRFDDRVMKAMGKVLRHRLVPEDMRAMSYDNRPLPIGHGQTISQPYIVALMTELLDPKPGHKVLEVGTGSGYQAAVLAELVDEVYSIEIVAPLAQRAKADLAALGYDNITLREGDGYYGWKEHAPFDGIVVTAAAPSIPPPLVQQLKPGGRMLIPVGAPFLTQELVLVEKTPHGKVRTRQILPVQFVPLTGGH